MGVQAAACVLPAGDVLQELISSFGIQGLLFEQNSTQAMWRGWPIEKWQRVTHAFVHASVCILKELPFQCEEAQLRKLLLHWCLAKQMSFADIFRVVRINHDNEALVWRVLNEVAYADLEGN